MLCATRAITWSVLRVLSRGAMMSAKTDEQEEVAMRLQNKVAIITGADSGIGKAIALQMAREGAAVTIDYIGPPDNATQVVRQIEDAGGKVIAVKADVTDVDQITNL